MKKNGILNSELAKVAADLGHTDLVCIGDLGLSVPTDVKKIDLALSKGNPGFQEVLDVYLDNIKVEKVFLADEIKIRNPEQWQVLQEKFSSDVEVEFISHEKLKAITRGVKAVVRTGEDTPYSNIVLQSGVII